MKGNMGDRNLDSMMKKGNGSAGSSCAQKGGMSGRGPPGMGGQQGGMMGGGMGRKLQGMSMLEELFGDDDDEKREGGMSGKGGRSG